LEPHSRQKKVPLKYDFLDPIGRGEVEMASVVTEARVMSTVNKIVIKMSCLKSINESDSYNGLKDKNDKGMKER